MIYSYILYKFIESNNSIQLFKTQININNYKNIIKPKSLNESIFDIVDTKIDSTHYTDIILYESMNYDILLYLDKKKIEYIKVQISKKDKKYTSIIPTHLINYLYLITKYDFYLNEDADVIAFLIPDTTKNIRISSNASRTGIKNEDGRIYMYNWIPSFKSNNKVATNMYNLLLKVTDQSNIYVEYTEDDARYNYFIYYMYIISLDITFKIEEEKITYNEYEVIIDNKELSYKFIKNCDNSFILKKTNSVKNEYYILLLRPSITNNKMEFKKERNNSKNSIEADEKKNYK
jgi:hypothetical protein